MAKPRMLFLCIGNSCRSQMAEGFLRHYGGDRFDAYSAGSAPSFVHPLTIEVMQEKGIDLSEHQSKSINDIDLEKINVVATLCGEADEFCPTFPKAVPVFKWHFPDPIRIVGSPEDRLNECRKVRDGIEQKIKEFLISHGS